MIMPEIDLIIRAVISAIAVLIFAIGCIMLVKGAISLLRAHGDLKKVKDSKITMLYGLLGILVSAGAFAVINFFLAF